MADETVSVGIDFELDSSDIQQVLNSQIQEISQSFNSVLSDIDSISRSLQNIVGPMKELADSAKEFESSLEKVKRLSEDIRSNVASTRLQTGTGGMAGTAGAATGIGGLFGGGMIGAGISAGAPIALAGGAFLGGTAASAQMFGGGGILGTIRQALRGTPIESALSGTFPSFFGSERSLQQREAQTREILAPGSFGSMLQAYQGGRTPAEIMQAMSPADRAAALGGAAGLVRGVGQGPMGLFTQFVGGQVGGRAGAQVAADLGGGEAMQQFAGAVGSSMFPGMFQNFIQQSMQMYPQLLQTRASQAAVGQYGGSIRDIGRLQPTRWGYAPGEIGGALSGLFQGFGGGDLTLETQRTAMAYSRAYGVDMGQIGQAMGGLINIGGGGQGMGARERESVMARVMTDAVAEGFGRRLPEYAQAVAGGMQTVMQGPALIGQDAIPQLVRTMSSLTGRVATAQGLGLAGAQRFLSPLAQAPQQMIEGLMSGEGDPFRMAMMWSTNRERFGNDPMRMLTGEGGLLEAAQNPFSRQALEFQRGGIQQILQGSPNDLTAMMSLRRMMPNISAQGALQVIQRGRAEIAERGSLEDVDMLELFTGVEESQESEGEQTRELMQDIQRDGERIMNEQLGAMRANAGFQAQQLAVAAAGAERAKQFYDVQLKWARLSAEAISASAAGQAIETFHTMFGDDFITELRGLPQGERVARLLQQTIDYGLELGVNPEEMAERRRSAIEAQERLAQQPEEQGFLQRVGSGARQAAFNLQLGIDRFVSGNSR